MPQFEPPYKKDPSLAIKHSGQISHGDWKITIRPELARQMTTRSIEKLQRSTEFFNQPVNADTVVIKELPWNEDPDVLSLAPWKRRAFRLLFFTGLIPTILSFFAARKHLMSLHERWENGTAATAWVIQAWFINIMQVLLSCQLLSLYFSYPTYFYETKPHTHTKYQCLQSSQASWRSRRSSGNGARD